MFTLPMRVRPGAPRAWLLACALLVFVVTIARPAFADGTAIATNAIAPYLDPIVLTVIGAIVSWIMGINGKYTKDATLRAAVNMAVQRAGGVAYDFLHSQEGRGDLVSLKNMAIATGVNHVLASIPLVLRMLGVTPDVIHTMVAGELGKLLAVDPNVSLTPATLANLAPMTLGTTTSAAPNAAPQASAVDAGGSAIAKALAVTLLAIGLTLGLTACAGGQLTAVTNATNATISQAQQKVQTAITLYGVAKGIAQVAELADPTLVPIVAGVTAAVDPQIAKAQAALNDATMDAAALEQLASAINAQANALTLQAAPEVHVLPNASPATAS